MSRSYTCSPPRASMACSGTALLLSFISWVIRRIFGPKRHEVTGEWRKLHNEELHILYSSSNIIRQIK
jgi:hypothetical protein